MAVSVEQARELALALPEAVEQDHHGRPSYRVGGRIFATQWTAERMNVMLDEDGVRTVVTRWPDVCAEVWWGNRLTAAGVALARADRELLRELLTDAWEGKAPKRLLGRWRSLCAREPSGGGRPDPLGRQAQAACPRGAE